MHVMVPFFSGMMRQLIEHEADISLILQISEQRSKLVDFYHVLSQTGLSLVTKKANIATSFSFISLLRVCFYQGFVTQQLMLFYSLRSQFGLPLVSPSWPSLPLVSSSVVPRVNVNQSLMF